MADTECPNVATPISPDTDTVVMGLVAPESVQEDSTYNVYAIVKNYDDFDKRIEIKYSISNQVVKTKPVVLVPGQRKCVRLSHSISDPGEYTHFVYVHFENHWGKTGERSILVSEIETSTTTPTVIPTATPTPSSTKIPTPEPTKAQEETNTPTIEQTPTTTPSSLEEFMTRVLWGILSIEALVVIGISVIAVLIVWTWPEDET